MTTKRRGRSRKNKIKKAVKRHATRVAELPAKLLREAARSRVQARVSRDAWSPPKAKTGEIQWAARHIEADKEVYEANFDGLAIEFDLWPTDHTDLETAARDAAEAQHGPIAATWLLYGIHAVNDAAKAVLPYPI
jgi:hypothetical protein